MFTDLMGMMGKLKEAQQKVEETKKRLDTVLVDQQSNDGLLKLTMTANRKLKSISSTTLCSKTKTSSKII
jgi:DNA-binding protein YbaB